MKSLFILIIFSFVFEAESAELFDGVYTKLTDVFSTERCQNPASSSPNQEACKEAQIQKSNIQDLQNISETAFYNRLAELQIDRLKCANDEWNSYSSKSEEGKINQEFMVAKINNILPDLQFLKNEINKLVSETQLLRGRLPSQFESRTNMDPKYEALKNEFIEKNEKAKQLMGAYELRLSEIPNSDHPMVRDFIEEHLSTYLSKKSTPVKEVEFERLIKDLNESFNNSIQGLEKSKSAGNYSLSIKEQAQFSSDPTLLGQLMNENQSVVQSLPYLQCSAKNRLRTKELTEVVGNVATMLIPMGALAVAKAARTAIIMRAPQMAHGFEQGARALGWVGMISGGVQTAQSVHKACFSIDKSEIKGECKKRPINLVEQHAYSSCIWQAMLSSAPHISKLVNGYLLTRLAENTELTAKMSEKIKMAVPTKVVVTASTLKSGIDTSEMFSRVKTRAQKALGVVLTNDKVQTIIEDGDVAINPVDMRIKKLMNAGFTSKQALQIIELKLTQP